jgi:hypothetical protein
MVPNWPVVIWSWTVSVPVTVTITVAVISWTWSIVRAGISWIAIRRDWNNCSRKRCRRPDYGACHGERKQKWVIATLGLGTDTCQNQKRHETDAENKAFLFHVTPPFA